MKVKRLLFVFVVLALTAAMVLPAAAQEAPSGTWLGTWPYAAPGTHNLNGFAAGGMNDNLGVTYRPLVTLTPAYFIWADNDYIGLLAESWGFVDDNTAYEYTIKEGAMWSDGSPVTAQDVVDTFDIGRILNWTQWTYLTSVEAVDDSTVRFNFTEGGASPNAERQILKEYVVDSATYGDLAGQARQVVADGAESGSDAWTAVATAIEEFRPETLNASGPYSYALSDVGEAFMTLKWQPNSLYSASVKFGEIKLWAGETEQTTPLVLSGELAYATNVYPPATIQSFADAGIRLITTPRGYGPALLYNFSVAPFDNVLVRQAMAYAINREQSALLTNGLGAHGTIYMSGILDSVTPNLLSQETIDSFNRYEFNLDTAASLMEQAGYTRNADGKWAGADGNTINVEYTFPADFADFSAAARDATAQLNEFGFDITERALPWQEAAAALRASDFELSVWSWGSGSPFAYQNLNNPVRRWTTALAEGQTGLMLDIRNFDYNGEIIDLNDAILSVSTGLDLAAQQERADMLAKLLNDEMLYIPLNEMLSVEPLNETLIAGAPADDDPIYLNPANEAFIIPLILDGTLSPAM
ncbi:MAG TPA: ABC transporter substrate-binding protein [Candidatus Limnocylindrales bacterium]|nr:ABC transporter substrate-binding protein [Candidatus Limnocylindrales bacterium]